MKVLSENALRVFEVSQNTSLEIRALENALEENAENVANFKLPLEHGRCLSGFRFIFDKMKVLPWFVVIVECSSIWPSWEDKNLYSILRKATGNGGPLVDGEGHLFTIDEVEDLVTFVTVFANFRWDFRVIGGSDKFQLVVKHDDECRIYFRTMSDEFISNLGKFF